MAGRETPSVVRTSIGDVRIEYLIRVDRLIRDFRELERQLAEVQAEIQAVVAPKSRSLTEIRKGKQPGDPTATAASRLEDLREREQRLLQDLADARFLMESARPEDLKLVRLFHSPRGGRTRRPTKREKQTRLDTLAGWAYQLYGDEIWADPEERLASDT